MLTLFITKYCKELTKMKKFLAEWDISYEIVPLQATDQQLTLPDYEAMVSGLGASYGECDFTMLISQKRRDSIAPKLTKLYPKDHVAYFNKNVTALRGLIAVDYERGITLLGYHSDDINVLIPREYREKQREKLYQEERHYE